ncbi:MAG TPA: hypothetical protein VNP73_11115 [Actinomycetota bacterium]|nr:hypothetical protein [Actinomycetota bacterium]
MRRVVFFLSIVVLVGSFACTDDEPEILAEQALSDFGPYTFVESEAEAESNLVEYMESVTPTGAHIVRVVVRSVRSESSEVSVEAVAATFHLADLETGPFQAKIEKRLAPGAREVLEGRGRLVDLEGTAALVAFLDDTTLIYLVGRHAADLETIATGLLDPNDS